MFHVEIKPANSLLHFQMQFYKFSILIQYQRIIQLRLTNNLKARNILLFNNIM